MIEAALDQAAAALAEARRVLAITGAGLSADSGLPTYRGVGGLYEQAPTEAGIDIEEALSGAMFARDPAFTWRYIAEIEAAGRDAWPNAGHRVLAGLAPRYERLCVLTQNVDGLHRAAGSTDLIEMHGDLHTLFCIDCGDRQTVTDYSAYTMLPPRCPICGGVMRPDVVLFGEMLPQGAVMRYEQALAAGFDTVLVIGTSAVFPYIMAPVHEAWQTGGTTIEINPRPTDASRFCAITVRERAADALFSLECRLL